jgi:type I restriction enzyme M protein
MPDERMFEAWEEAQDYQLRLDNEGLIVDFLDESIHRPNTAEERVRQRMLHVLHHEYGYARDLMAVERGVQMGRETKRADIVVYMSAEAQESHDQGQIAIIGETKSPDEKEPDGQLPSYISATSAGGGFWTNGDTMLCYRRALQGRELSLWVGIPKHGEAWDAIGRWRKNDLVQPIDLKVVFRRCHNELYSDGAYSEDIALDMVRIILAKIEDESSSRDECQFYITPEEYESDAGRMASADRVRALFASVRNRFPDVFSASEEIGAGDRQLAIVVSNLQRYTLLDAPYDVIGTAYETYVASHLKGERGQYFTSRLVVNMMVAMANPGDRDTVLDPACGSGGFLVAAMNHCFRRIDRSGRSSTARELLKRNIVHNLFGVDITAKLVKVAKANMLLGKDGHGGIIRHDSLSAFADFPASFMERAGERKPTMIFTNPPFGSGHEQRVRNPDQLRNFRVGRLWTADGKGGVKYSDALNTSQGVAPEVLFLERCIQWVQPGGIVAIVMAKGQLDNREAYAIRHLVLKECQVLAVVNLHEDTFEPFCGSKASVLILRRKVKGDTDDYRIFMAISNHVGQTSRGVPIFKKDAEGREIVVDGRRVPDEDLTDIAALYRAFQSGELDETPYRFSVSRADISADTYTLNPVQYLPAHNAALKQVLSMGESEAFAVRRLGDIARVFNGPRFKRPYADLGVTEGPTIRKYFTGTALTQLQGDNVKYLDSRKGDRQTQKNLDALTVHKGYIVISDSGTLGRVSYVLSQHDGHVATNNLIRVVIEDEALRGYVYQFLRSDVGQKLMLKSAYGTNQEHLEPDVISDVPIPVPTDEAVLKKIGGSVISSIEALEKSIAESQEATRELTTLFAAAEETMEYARD